MQCSQVVLRNPYTWEFDFQKCVQVNNDEFWQLQPMMSISPGGVRIIWHACLTHTGSPLSCSLLQCWVTTNNAPKGNLVTGTQLSATSLHHLWCILFRWLILTSIIFFFSNVFGEALQSPDKSWNPWSVIPFKLHINTLAGTVVFLFPLF